MRWRVGAGVAPVALAVWLLAGSPGPEVLVFPRGVEIRTAAAAALAAGSVSLACLVAIVHRRAGLVLLAVALAVAAVSWPLIQDNPVAGQVIHGGVAGHGVHRNDLLAALPAAGAVACLVAARRSVRATGRAG
jgi:hypothetical protein